MIMYLTTFLLYIAIIIIAFGIQTNNVILLVIGVFIVGAYNAIMYYKQD